MSNNLKVPSSSKLILKGTVPAQLAAKGYDTAALRPYMQTLVPGDVPNLGEACSQVANLVVDRVLEQNDVTVWDGANGEGFVEALRTQLSSDFEALALSTASQTKAFKSTLIANSEEGENKLTEADFVSVAKASPKVKEEAPGLFR